MHGAPRNPWTGLSLASLITAAPATPFVPALGRALVVAALALGAVGAVRAWRTGAGPVRRTVALAAVLLPAALLAWGVTVRLSADSVRHTVSVNGESRAYRLHVPAGGPSADAPAGTTRPAVLAFHGLTQSVASMERMSRLDEASDRHGFLVAYPEGYRRSWNDTDTIKPATRAGIDDVAFARAVADDLVRRHGADPARIYAAGFSNGGFLALRLACESSGRIAAVAAVGAGATGSFPPGCDDGPPAPAAFVLGTGDPLVPWDVFGGSGGEWARRLGCENGPEIDRRADRVDDGTTARIERWTDCPDGSEVIQVVVDGGGHAWPGGRAYLPSLLIGRTSGNVDASEEIWRFFERHTLEDSP